MSTSRLNWGPPGFRKESSQSTVTCGCCAKAGELLLYYFSPMLCVGVLIPAAIALSAITEAEDYIDDYNGLSDDIFDRSQIRQIHSTFDAGGSRGIAAWAIFVSSVIMLFHIGVFITCRVSACYNVNIPYVPYSVVMSIFCCLTAFGLIAGGIANIVFFIDNNEIYSDLDCGSSEDSGGICSDLFSINACEITCGAISLGLSLMYMILLVLVICHGYRIYRRNTVARSRTHQSSTVAQPSHDQLSAPSSVQPSAPPHIQEDEPSNLSTNKLPPKSKPVDSATPPSYRSTLTNPPTYEAALKLIEAPPVK